MLVSIHWCVRRHVWRAIAVALAGLAFGAHAAAQTTDPVQPAGVGQDEVDLQGRLNIALGSGARALGMGGAFLARADDATAASWNPAGLSYLLRPEASLVWAQNRITADSPEEASHFRGREIDFGALTLPIHSISGSVQLCYQRIVPFTGRRTILRGKSYATLDAQGGFDVFALGTGWRVTPTLRVGATLNHWLNGFHQKKQLDRTLAGRRDTDLEATFKFRGWNMNLGLIWSPHENFNIGAVAKTPFTGRVRLAKSRTDYFTAAGGAESFTTNESNSNDLRLDFPATYGIGASWRPRSSLTLSADYTFTAWSKAQIHGFYVLKVAQPTDDSQPQEPPTLDVFDSLPYPLLNAPQTDAQQLRFGAEYVFIYRHLKFPLRAGYIFDRQFFQASDGHGPIFGAVTLGTGILAGPMLLDVAYVREAGHFTTTDGVFTNQATYRLFASAIFRLGALR